MSTDDEYTERDDSCGYCGAVHSDFSECRMPG